MAIARVNTPTIASGADSTVTVTLPTGWAAGQCAVIAIAISDDTQSITPPAGWTEEFETGNAGNLIKLGVYTRILQGGDSNPAFTISASVSFTYGCVTYSGVRQTTPVDVKSSNSGTSGVSGDVIASAVTPTVANTMLVGSFLCDSNGTYTPPSGMSEAVDGISGGPRIEMADESYATTTSTGTRTAVHSNTNISWVAIMLALAPQSAAPAFRPGPNPAILAM